MSALPPDYEDGPPNIPIDPRERSTLPPEAYTTDEEITKVETPIPKRRDTPVVTAADLMAALNRLEGKVDDLSATVKALYRGMVGLTNATTEELSALRADMRQGFEGVRTWLFGDEVDQRTIRTGLAHHIRAASELGKSALDSAGEANDTALRAVAIAEDTREHLHQHLAANGANGSAE